MKNTRNKKSCIFLVRKYILYILHRTSEHSKCIHSYMLPLQSPEDPLLFNEILCFPQAGGITQQDWVSPHIEGGLYDVTSSSRDRRNNSRRPLTYSITNKNNTITAKERHIMTKYELLIFESKTSELECCIDTNSQRLFSRELLPTLGLPTITTWTPSLSLSPRRWSDRCVVISVHNLSTSAVTTSINNTVYSFNCISS